MNKKNKFNYFINKKMSSYSREVIKVCIRMRPLLTPYEDEEI